MRMVLVLFVMLSVWACQPRVERDPATAIMEVTGDTVVRKLPLPSRDQLYDKILGSLAGSAMGDAMGAPTEMWDRQDRVISFGYVDDLDKAFIDPSPEGIWAFQLPAGTTTDDTRWKYLVGKYVVQHTASFYRQEGPDPFTFAKYVRDSYQNEVLRLKQTPGHDPEKFEENIRRMTWLQEWAVVAEPFSKNDLEGYTRALHRFYGGELLCAGMLYAPALALPYPGDPQSAYQSAFRLGIFDQGYARDITGLTAAMVAAALSPEATPQSIMEVFSAVDPHQYFRSRLLGRVAFRTYQQAQRIEHQTKSLTACDPKKKLSLPLVAGDSLKTCRMEMAFEWLDKMNQDAPAHAQEILLVAITAMLVSDFNFQDCMEFITNYGRDNDTSGAVAGAVLGAYWGFEKLPETQKQKVLQTNRVHLGIDLEALAMELTDSIVRNDMP